MVTIGSICSGIEAASVAWGSFDVEFSWFSEIADFPSRVLKEKYPHVANLGDMTIIPTLIENEEIQAPDIICGGTPCQAFSLAGWKNGLMDDRGNLTLRFVDVIEACDEIRMRNNVSRTKVFWENVEGVLSDRTNAFGCFISSLAGLSDVIAPRIKRWPNAGVLRGPKRNIAWRVLDSKFFGLPQQRKRLYVIAGGKDFFPERVLFENHKFTLGEYPSFPLEFEKDGCSFEVFRSYTDCLYSAYGTKWNGNAAANNGSLFIVQDGRIRRFSPIECERLMGFPDNYTNLDKSTKTCRYQAIGNSWAVPVVKWIGKRLIESDDLCDLIDETDPCLIKYNISVDDNSLLLLLDDIVELSNRSINCSVIPEQPKYTSLKEIVSSNAQEDIFMSPVGCYGILRRKEERNLKMNNRLEKILKNISSQISIDEIEKRSRIQKRGRFSNDSNIPSLECSDKDKQIQEDQLFFDFT